MTVVAVGAPHPRDARLAFDAEEHAYWWDGVRVSCSVTGLWETYFPEFDSDSTIQTYFASWKANPKSKYSALCQYLELIHGADETAQKRAIASLWEANRTNAAALGTSLHAAIEDHLITGRLPADGTTPEFRQYVKWRAEVAAAWQPLRVEWRVYDDKAGIAGTIDSLWLDGDGRLVLVDWKRCKKGALEQKAFRGETGWGPCSEMPNTPVGHYTLQQSLYASILARNYQLVVDRAVLVQLHPDLKTYNAVTVPLLYDVATAMLDEHQHECHDGL